LNGDALEVVAAREQMEDAMGLPRGAMRLEEAALWAQGYLTEAAGAVLDCARWFTVADAKGEPLRG
jgi:hypothetical protein